MTTRIWTGGNADAADPSARSPAGAPQPGDRLDMGQGTMSVTDDGSVQKLGGSRRHRQLRAWAGDRLKEVGSYSVWC